MYTILTKYLILSYKVSVSSQPAVLPVSTQLRCVRVKGRHHAKVRDLIIQQTKTIPKITISITLDQFILFLLIALTLFENGWWKCTEDSNVTGGKSQSNKIEKKKKVFHLPSLHSFLSLFRPFLIDCL